MANFEYIAGGNATALLPAGEYVAQILRGWPEGGARERTELVAAGSTLYNGDWVVPQADGTVAKSPAGSNKNVGLVIRGNGDSSSAANSQGLMSNTQPLKSISALPTWAAGTSGSGGYLTLTVTAHGFAVGQTVNIVTGGAFASTTAIAGSYVVESVPTVNTFTVAISANPLVTVIGTSTAQLTSGFSTNGKAVVLWGNFIVATSNFAAGTYAPGTYLTSTGGQIAAASATTPATTDIGFVLRVQGQSGTTPGYVVAAIY